MTRKMPVLWKILLIVIIILLCAAVFCAIRILPYIAALRLDPQAKARIKNNEYISADYPGWTQIGLEDGVSIKMPQGWSLIWTEDTAKILAGGEIVGYGLRRSHSNTREVNDAKYTSFLNTIVGFYPDSREVEDYFIPNSGTIAEYTKVTYTSSDGETRQFYRVNTWTHGAVYLYDFFFDITGGEHDEAMLDIIMAIAYSYEEP